MKHYRYKLVDFLSEAQQDFADTKQFYGGDSDTGIQAGKPGNADFNSKTIADIYASGVEVYQTAAAAVRQNTKVKGDLDIKDLKASSQAKVKLPFVQGEVESVVNLKKGTLRTVGEFDLKLGDKSYKAKIKDMDLTDPTKIKNSPFSLTIDGPKGPQTFDIHIQPGGKGKGTKYSAGYVKTGKLGDDSVSKAKYSFSVNAVVPPNVSDTKGSFDLVLSQLNSKKRSGTTINVGGSASKEGVSLKVGGGREFNFELIGTGGKANLSVVSSVGKDFGQKGTNVAAGVQATFTLPSKKSSKEETTRAGDITSKALNKYIPQYVEKSTDVKQGGLKSDEEGKSNISGDIEAFKQDVKGATKAVKKTIQKENIITITKKDLSLLIEKLLD